MFCFPTHEYLLLLSFPFCFSFSSVGYFFLDDSASLHTLISSGDIGSHHMDFQNLYLFYLDSGYKKYLDSLIF
jgi:hypothetical protein